MVKSTSPAVTERVLWWTCESRSIVPANSKQIEPPVGALVLLNGYKASEKGHAVPDARPLSWQMLPNLCTDEIAGHLEVVDPRQLRPQGFANNVGCRADRNQGLTQRLMLRFAQIVAFDAVDGLIQRLADFLGLGQFRVEVARDALYILMRAQNDLHRLQHAGWFVSAHLSRLNGM